MTDGVFYDVPRPVMASRGLAHCECLLRALRAAVLTTCTSVNVLTYALGIAIPNDGNNHGLTKSEVKLQHSQLLAFANNTEDRVLNFGEEGLLLLDSIAENIVARLPGDVEDGLPYVIDKPYWCEWSSMAR
jgi:hypothetical protein